MDHIYVYMCMCLYKMYNICLFPLNISVCRSSLLPSKELHVSLSIFLYSRIEFWK